MKIIEELPGAYSSKVELVEIDGAKFVLKTATEVEIANEKAFCKILQLHSIPTLRSIDQPDLRADQLLLEYITGSPTVGDHLSVELCQQWGAALRAIHTVESLHAEIMDENGLHTITWGDFIEQQIQEARTRATEKNSTLPIEAIERYLTPLLTYQPPRMGLLHGDMHANNVLIDGENVLIFDKGSSIFYGDPLFDLALIAMEFSNGLYIESEETEHAKDAEYVQAFIQGYGIDFISENRELVDQYVVLRAYMRYPNPFEPHLLDIMQRIID